MAISKVIANDLDINIYTPIFTVQSIDHAMTHRIATTQREDEPETLRVLIAPIGMIKGAIDRQREVLSATLRQQADIGIVKSERGALVIQANGGDSISEDIGALIGQEISKIIFGDARWRNSQWKTLNWQWVGTKLPPSNELRFHKRQ